jgi:hypothetical protein
MMRQPLGGVRSTSPTKVKLYLGSLFSLIFLSGFEGAIGIVAGVIVISALAILSLSRNEITAFFAMSVGILVGGIVGKAIFGGTFTASDAPVMIESVFGVIALLRCTHASILSQRSFRPSISPMTWALIAFCLVDVWVFVRIPEEMRSWQSYIGLIIRFSAFVWMSFRVGKRSSAAELTWYWAGLSLTFVGSASVYWFTVSKIEVLSTYGVAMARISSIAGDPNYIGSGCAISILLALPLLRSKQYRLITGSVIFFLIVCMFWTGSRTAILGFIAGALGGTLIYTVRMDSSNRLTSIIFIILMAVIVWGALLPQPYQERLLDMNYKQSTRYDVLWGGWNEFLRNPWSGGGARYYLGSEFKGKSRLGAHNSIVETAAEGGIPFLAAHLLVLLMLVKCAWRSVKSGEALDISLAYLATLICFLVVIQGINVLVYRGAPQFFPVFGCAFSLLAFLESRSLKPVQMGMWYKNTAVPKVVWKTKHVGFHDRRNN